LPGLRRERDGMVAALHVKHGLVEHLCHHLNLVARIR
jgi:hypothetical protein